MPDDDPLDELDRNLGIATKLAALPVLIDMLLSLVMGLLQSGCVGLIVIGFILLLLVVNYPWVSLAVVALLAAIAVREAWRRVGERPRGPRRGGTGH